MEKETLGDKVRRLRVARGLSIESLSKQLGIGMATISSVENGKGKRPSHYTLELVAKGLGLTLDELTRDVTMPGEGTPHPGRPSLARRRQGRFVGMDELARLMAERIGISVEDLDARVQALGTTVAQLAGVDSQRLAASGEPMELEALADEFVVRLEEEQEAARTAARPQAPPDVPPLPRTLRALETTRDYLGPDDLAELDEEVSEVIAIRARQIKRRKQAP